MKNVEAIEVLRRLQDPEPWEPQLNSAAYDALDMAISALEKQVEETPFPDDDTSILACPYCGSGEYLHNADENRNLFCGQCGQRIDWSGDMGWWTDD